MTTLKRERIDRFTERAIRATDAGKLIPPIVYLPKMLRGQNVRLTADMLTLTVDPPTIKENHVRIAQADPIGFLLAMMHGQPIPSFNITKDGAIEISYHVPEMAARERIAKWLGSRVTLRLAGDNQPNGKTKTDGWDTMVHNAAGDDGQEDEA